MVVAGGNDGDDVVAAESKLSNIGSSIVKVVGLVGLLKGRDGVLPPSLASAVAAVAVVVEACGIAAAFDFVAVVVVVFWIDNDDFTITPVGLLTALSLESVIDEDDIGLVDEASPSIGDDPLDIIDTWTKLK